MKSKKILLMVVALLVATPIMMAQVIETEGGGIYLRNLGDETILAAAVCERKRCILLVDEHQQIAPGERGLIYSTEEGIQPTGNWQGNWKAAVIVTESSSKIEPGNPQAVKAMRDYFEGVAEIAAGLEVSEGAAPLKRAAKQRSSTARGPAVDAAKGGRAVGLLKKLPVDEAIESTPPNRKGKGPTAKAAGNPYGFEYFYPTDTFCNEAQWGPGIAHCNHTAKCEFYFGEPNGGITLAVGFQSRTDCGYHVARAQSDVRFRELNASGSIRHGIFGTDMVPPGFWVESCDGSVFLIPGGQTNSCSIWPF